MLPTKQQTAHTGNPRAFWAALADALTLSRLIIAGVILILGLTLGPEAIGLVFFLTLSAWTTDLLDGNFARRSGTARTRLADWDLWIDIALVWATLAYASLASLLHPALALLHPALLGVAFFALHSPARAREVNTVAHAVTFGAVVMGAPGLLGPLLAWASAMLVAFRRRAVQETAAFRQRWCGGRVSRQGP